MGTYQNSTSFMIEKVAALAVDLLVSSVVLSGGTFICAVALASHAGLLVW